MRKSTGSVPVFSNSLEPGPTPNFFLRAIDKEGHSSIMPFSRGFSCGQDPCQGASGGVFRDQNPCFSPTRFHDDPTLHKIVGVRFRTNER